MYIGIDCMCDEQPRNKTRSDAAKGNELAFGQLCWPSASIPTLLEPSLSNRVFVSCWLWCVFL